MSGNAHVGRRLQPRTNGSWASQTLLVACFFAMPWAIAARAQTTVSDADLAAPLEQTTAEVLANDPGPMLSTANLAGQADHLADAAILWYRTTPPGDRVAWGGLAVSCILGISILLERMVRLRERRIIPSDFTAKFLDRLHGGKLDAGRALDYCEENPSPAARVALAAVRRWGRPATDLERAVALAHRVESDKLRRNVGTLRRIAALTPLVGFLGTLLAVGRTLAAIPAEAAGEDGFVSGLHWGPELASALAPLTAGIVIATLAIVTYDGLMARIERLAGSLDRLGAETIDAIAMSIPTVPSSLAVPTSRSGELAIDSLPPNFRMHGPSDTPPSGIFGLVRPPYQSPATQSRPADRPSLRLTKPRPEGNTSAQA